MISERHGNRVPGLICVLYLLVLICELQLRGQVVKLLLFLLRATVSPRQGRRNIHRRRTFLVFSSSDKASSRWCSRLNLLILSWSSRRTSTSSVAASSSLDS